MWILILICSVPIVEAGSNTSTAALRVVEGEEKGTRCLGVQLDHPVTEDINTETWSSRLGVGREADDLAL
jgi:hypothetical protein